MHVEFDEASDCAALYYLVVPKRNDMTFYNTICEDKCGTQLNMS